MIGRHFGSSPEPVPCPFAAAVVDADRVAVLLPDTDDAGPPSRTPGIGSVLIWAGHDDRDVVVVAPIDTAARLARQADVFDRLSVWTLSGATIEPAVPADLAIVPRLSDNTLAHADFFASAGAVAVDDFGCLVAEVEGLEIGRASGDDGDLEIGIGTTDRELHSYVHGNSDPAESLHRAAALIRSIRRPGAPGHPLNRRGRQRWLRSVAHLDPRLVGAVELAMLPPLAARVLQLGPEPAAALDRSSSTLYLFSVGIDPELVPDASDYRRRHRPARTVVVTTVGDRFGATVDLASGAGIESMTMNGPW